MRILIIAPMVPQAHGPGAIAVLLQTQLEALRERHELTLVTGVGDEPGEVPAAQALIGTGVDVHFANRRRPPVVRQRWRRRWRLASGWVRTGWPWRTVWFAAPAVQAVLDELAATRLFDVVIVEDSSMAMFRLPPGVPAVLTEHEVRRPRATVWHPGGPAAWPQWAFRELDWRRWEGFQRAAWRRYDRVQVFTEHDARAIANLAPDLFPRVRINPFGLIMPPEADPSREEPGNVLFIGNFTHSPNRDAAVWLVREIMPRIRTRHAGARLRIVGSAPPPEVLELAAPDVDVIADAPRIEPYLQAASVVVAPLRIGGGMRMKVLQALASGKPMVTTARGAEGYAAPGRALPMVVADDAEGIAAATAELLGDEWRRHALGRRARAFAEEQHSPGAWGARLETVYEEARSRGRNPVGPP